MYKCNQCYNISDCDIYLSLQKLINKNKNINLQLMVEKCDNYTSAIQKFIDNMEGDKMTIDKMTIEEAKKEMGFINFDELNKRMRKLLYDIEE